jgi:hypothetical protein
MDTAKVGLFSRKVVLSGLKPSFSGGKADFSLEKVPYLSSGHTFQCSGSGSTRSTCFWASWIRIRILLSSCKNSKKNLDSFHFVTLFDFLSLKNDVNVPSKSNEKKKFLLKISFLLAS